MRRALVGATATLAAAAVIVTAAAGGAGAAPRATVTVKAFDFQPDPLRIKPGTTVTWVNRDAIHHSVTAGTRSHPTRQFDRLLRESGGRASITFRRPGTYRYFCRFHPGSGMTATVIVR
jgi:plastocyanin